MDGGIEGRVVLLCSRALRPRRQEVNVVGRSGAAKCTTMEINGGGGGLRSDKNHALPASSDKGAARALPLWDLDGCIIIMAKVEIGSFPITRIKEVRKIRPLDCLFRKSVAIA